METWDGWKIIDGWGVAHTADGKTLTAQFFSRSRENAPVRSSPVPVTGINAVPAGFMSYRITEVQFSPVSSVGPYVIQVTARPGTGSCGVGNTGETLLRTNVLTASYMDYQIQPAWCGLRPALADTKSETVSGWNSGKWASAVAGDSAGSWASWLAADGISGSPFTKIVNPRMADQTLRFLQILVSFYVKETNAGLARWGGFSGIVPINSMPGWITIPGGDNRWRLFDEEISREMETDGKTKLFHVTRTLLGIPAAARDRGGNRLQWDQNEIGQRDWDDL